VEIGKERERECPIFTGLGTHARVNARSLFKVSTALAGKQFPDSKQMNRVSESVKIHHHQGFHPKKPMPHTKPRVKKKKRLVSDNMRPGNCKEMPDVQICLERLARRRRADMTSQMKDGVNGLK